MRMKPSRLLKSSKFKLTVVGLLALIPLSLANAGTVVRQLDEATLLVVEYRGKPPHKRRIVTADEPVAFAHYQEIMDRPTRTLFAGVFRAGPPGKSFPHSRRLRDVNAEQQTEQVEFARFEETTVEEEPKRRFWRGAPGKGRPIIRD